VKDQGLATRAKLGILGGALFVALLIGWFFAITPKRHEAASLADQIDETQSQIAALQGGGPESSVQPIRVADLFELSRAMPDRPDIPSVLLQLSQISAETGVSFQSITPRDPEQLGSYQRLSIDLVFQGHFYDLSDFLYRLRNMVRVHQGVLSATGRLFSVDSISFDEGELKFPQVKARLTVSAYVYGDGTVVQPPIVSPPPATAASAQATGAPSATAPANESSQPIPAAPSGTSAAGAIK
jgi:hypothetical protein